MKPVARHSAFTLIELLVVISMIGILAAITMPTLSNFRKADAMAAATRQLQDDVERARQLAISHRTTVYMVFCPSNFWNDVLRQPPGVPNQFTSLPQSEKDKAQQLLDKQLTSYTFVTLRSVGSQPGQIAPRYLSDWRTLPEGMIIPSFKFRPRNDPFVRLTASDPVLGVRNFDVRGFERTSTIPFPSAEAYNPALPNQRFVTVPFIAFNHLGQVVSSVGDDEYIPLAKGRVAPALDVNKFPLQQSPTVVESPPGNSTNAFTLIRIDRLTGRARVEKQELPPQ